MAGMLSSNVGGCNPEQYESVLNALHSDAAAATALCQVFATSNRTEDVAFGLNTVFMLLSGALVFIMHGGFAMLEAGAIRSKNAMNILLQTVLDGAASAVMWYLVGFGFAYGIGDNPNGFIGNALFGLSRFASHESGTGVGNWANWFFQWAFCATAATIPAGAVAERFNFNAYLGYSLFLGGFVYPVVVHWVWCRTGWLGYGADKPLLGAGMIDFAGSGVVHMTGGLAGLIGAAMVGPRLGRFDANGQPVPMPGHSAILVVLGTVLLWFGWYGFNPGSALVADIPDAARVAGRAAVTTTLSGAAGGLTCLALAVARHLSWDLTSLCNGMLVGFVSVTAGCAVVEPWAALLAGGLGAVLFEAASAALLRLRVDDVVAAGPMHGVCGAWGVLFVGLLAKQEYVRQAYPTREMYPYGLFYGGGGKLLASQVIGVLSIAGWVGGTMGPFFAAFSRARCLRISAEDEAVGLDASKHGGSAYNYNLPHGSTQGSGGGAWDGLTATGQAAVLYGNNNDMHSPLAYVNGMLTGGGGTRYPGDGIIRGQIIGGGGGGGNGSVTNGIGGGGSGGGDIVAPFDGLNGLAATAAGGAIAAAAAAGYHHRNQQDVYCNTRTGNGVDVGDVSVHGDMPRMYRISPSAAQQYGSTYRPPAAAPAVVRTGEANGVGRSGEVEPSQSLAAGASSAVPAGEVEVMLPGGPGAGGPGGGPGGAGLPPSARGPSGFHRRDAAAAPASVYDGGVDRRSSPARVATTFEMEAVSRGGGGDSPSQGDTSHP